MSQIDTTNRRRDHRGQSMQAVLLVVLVVFLVQLWLITIALESYLAARTGYAVPTFVASGACFAVNLWLLKELLDVDRGEEST
ncbi:MAG: hypothetical protein EB084_18320 [Proteobacteria bacterium]|nr:hypothetical protein [Pseudomonadota bacterium]